jgi:hypothetical protein
MDSNRCRCSQNRRCLSRFLGFRSPTRNSRSRIRCCPNRCRRSIRFRNWSHRSRTRCLSRFLSLCRNHSPSFHSRTRNSRFQSPCCRSRCCLSRCRWSQTRCFQSQCFQHRRSQPRCLMCRSPGWWLRRDLRIRRSRSKIRALPWRRERELRCGGKVSLHHPDTKWAQSWLPGE